MLPPFDYFFIQILLYTKTNSFNLAAECGRYLFSFYISAPVHICMTFAVMKHFPLQEHQFKFTFLIFWLLAVVFIS